MAEEDYYQTLGVSRSASAEEIKTAYLQLARKHHPDKNPDDKTAKAKFQKIQTAFDVLNDPSKRELYDRYGSSFESMGAGPGPRGAGRGPASGSHGFEDVDFGQLFGERFGDEGGGGFADIFKQFTRGGGAKKRGRSAARGQDILERLTIPFHTAVAGGEVQLSLQRASGKVETLAVKIPAGIDEGAKIRLRGQGGEGVGSGKPGDILLTIHIEPHPAYVRRGNDLTVKVPVTLAEAALGAKIDVPTPQGVLSLRIPPNTSSGKKLRLKGQGVHRKGEEPGDLYAEIQIVLPNPLSEETLAAIRAHEVDKPANPRGDLHW
ncbi:MAG TPA: J domain-containing protein [Pirellulales bacterium]|jgi:DnaJ-class molecular chaperone|nr:J domain-containing protein [Pirellulales bacterium]